MNALGTTIEKACRLYGISRSLGYEAKDDLGAVRVGGRLVVPLAVIAKNLGVSLAEVEERLAGLREPQHEATPEATPRRLRGRPRRTS